MSILRLCFRLLLSVLSSRDTAWAILGVYLLDRRELCDNSVIVERTRLEDLHIWHSLRFDPHERRAVRTEAIANVHPTVAFAFPGSHVS